jgi:Mat/Ecp fimbriae major subunit
MKKIIVTVLVAAGMIVLAGTAFAADAAANATATIQQAISISKTTENPSGGDLAFGTIVPDVNGGSVRIDPISLQRLDDTGSLVLLPSTFGCATFQVLGSAGASFAISLPPSAITIQSGLGDSMTVDSWATNAPGSPSLSLQGQYQFNVGGTLHVQPNQPDGQYAGTFTVSVDYN